jgi:PIN domain nuclease of toxin-antitoxin system
MKLLLDTHTLIWWWADDKRLSLKAKKAIADETNAVLVSSASAWEIATKYRLGKLPEADQLLIRFAELIEADGFSHLPIDYFHAIRSGRIQNDHRDPFDRILAAQAELENAVLVTIDEAFKAFGIKTLWQ